MNTSNVVFLSLLFVGIAALVAGNGLTRVHWRPDILQYSRRTRSLHVMLHPEEYVKDAPLRAIRSLNLAGGFLIVGAAVVVTYDVLRAVLYR